MSTCVKRNISPHLERNPSHSTIPSNMCLLSNQKENVSMFLSAKSVCASITRINVKQAAALLKSRSAGHVFMAIIIPWVIYKFRIISFEREDKRERVGNKSAESTTL